MYKTVGKTRKSEFENTSRCEIRSILSWNQYVDHYWVIRHRTSSSTSHPVRSPWLTVCRTSQVRATEMASARDPTVGLSWEIVKLKLWYVSLDLESVRSGKIQWPENETGEGFRKNWKFSKMLKICWILKQILHRRGYLTWRVLCDVIVHVDNARKSNIVTLSLTSGARVTPSCVSASDANRAS